MTTSAQTMFITIDLAHRDCEKCADCADSARTMAQVSGSVGASHQDGTHYATVQRADRMHDIHPDAVDPISADINSLLQQFVERKDGRSGSELRKNVLRWAVRQGYPASVRIALGDLVLAAVNADPRDMVAATTGQAREIVPGTGVYSHSDWAAYEHSMSH